MFICSSEKEITREEAAVETLQKKCDHVSEVKDKQLQHAAAAAAAAAAAEYNIAQLAIYHISYTASWNINQAL